ncbi:MAG TPA: hypothetical protein VHM19_20570, partial [Polyangiales bacterium]|nr:hypothetical protein [Polyangiales bacterium]
MTATVIQRELGPRSVCLVMGLTLAALPFTASEYVPATDMPQHMAQVRLLEEMCGFEPSTVDMSSMEARPFGPHSLVYWPMFMLARVCSLQLAGKLTLLLLVLASVAAIHELARRRNRHPVHALLAGVLVFSGPLYWGFLNFLCGLPLFLLFFDRLASERPERTRWREAALDAGLLFLLAWAHLFWIPCAALASLGTSAARRDVAGALPRTASLLPITFIVAPWIPSLAQGHNWLGVGGRAQYTSSLLDRTSWTWIVRTFFGGLRGPTEAWTCVALFAYAAWVMFAARSAGRSAYDLRLLLFGACLALFAFVAPDEYFNTLLVGGRFLPIAGMFLLLALPDVPDRVSSTLAGVVAACFALSTTIGWAYYDQIDISGLRQALALVPEAKSVLGLNLRPKATAVYNNAFIQTFAYFQADHGGEL